MRLIDADALMKTLGITDMDCDKCAWHDREWSNCKRGGDFEDACCAIEGAPTIEERKTGRWIYGENDGQDGWYCSECKGFIPWDYDFYGLNNIDFIKDFKTCPFCDSKMISCTGSENMER